MRSADLTHSEMRSAEGSKAWFESLVIVPLWISPPFILRRPRSFPRDPLFAHGPVPRF